ncbi:MAG: hypothetical protein AAFV53_39795 [Myxococcota bacterium]
MTQSPALILQLDPEASMMLDLLVELGHLDEKLLNTVNDQLLDLKIPGGRVTVDDVRRVVAEAVFENFDEMDPEYRRMLENEWGMLFY